MAIQKKQPPVSASKNNVKVTDAKMFAPLTTKTPTQTKKSIVPTTKPKPKTTSKPKATSKPKPNPKATTKPKPNLTPKPMPDTSKTYNQRLMMKSSPMPMLDASMTNEQMKSIRMQEPRQKTFSKDESPKRGSTLERKMTTVSTSRDTTRTAYPEKISPSGTKSQLTKVTYNKYNKK